jgi:hypothetical protein
LSPVGATAATTATTLTTPTQEDGVVALGRAYLRAHPDEANLAALVREVPQLEEGEGARARLPELTVAVSDDFAAGRMVTVDGWQLSASEARAAAAVALGS